MNLSELKKGIESLTVEELLSVLSDSQIFRIGVEADRRSTTSDIMDVLISNFTNTDINELDIDRIYRDVQRYLSNETCNSEYTQAIVDAIKINILPF